MKRGSKALLVLLFAMLCCGTLFAGPINGFDPSGMPEGTSVSFSGCCGGGPSAAEYWSAWINTPGTLTTTVLPSAMIGGSPYMIDVNTTSGDNGIYQYGSYPSSISVWVKPMSGVVEFAAGCCSTNWVSAYSTTIGVWQQLTLTPPVGTNEIIFYSSSAGGANFYATDINIQATPPSSAVPEPSVAFLILPAFMGLVGLRRKLTK